ncbi:hypothetical protein HK104_001823 [Borealophlyctis nickersoniae]|nr:hypothetical protein HK104_001823 [Borealophlyctis nickersoniae]
MEGTPSLVRVSLPSVVEFGGGISSNDGAGQFISRAYTRMLHYISKQCHIDVAQPVLRVRVDVEGDVRVGPEHLGYDTDEGYTLDVFEGVGVRAGSVYGALRAFQTLQQLFVPHHHTCYLFTGLHITDSPRFPHRGLMLDTSRHFFPVPDILLLLDGMVTIPTRLALSNVRFKKQSTQITQAQTKMNVFHWHIIDAQSFPVRWTWKGVDVAEVGAYRYKDGRLKVYEREDVERIVGKLPFYRDMEKKDGF